MEKVHYYLNGISYGKTNKLQKYYEMQQRSICYTTYYYCGWLLAELDDFSKEHIFKKSIENM